MCDTGPGVAFMGKSYAVADLKDKQKLEPGYYAISVVVGFGNDPRAGASGDKSNWITVQVDLLGPLSGGRPALPDQAPDRAPLVPVVTLCGAIPPRPRGCRWRGVRKVIAKIVA
jgi:hypothetical protein